MKILIIIVGIVIGISIITILYYRHHTARQMEQINFLLDQAIAGNIEETAYDESRLSQIETKLRRFLSSSHLSQSSIEKEQERIKSLIGDISHQTKTPIANILIYTELLLEDPGLPEKSRQLAGQIEPQAKKLDFLIQSLIKTSRLESGVVAIRPTVSSINNLLEKAVSGCRLPAEAKNISLTVPPLPDTLALFDLKWTAEALYNIIDNAVKYTPAGGSITVAVIPYEMFVRIDICDTGIGIRESDVSKLFERFWRAGEAAGQEGVGIGLYLTREIIVQQNGYIKVESKPGSGSVFSVFLPRT